MLAVSCVAAFLLALVGTSVSQTSFALYNRRYAESANFGIETSIDRPELEALHKYFLEDPYSCLCAKGIWAAYYGEDYRPAPHGFVHHVVYGCCLPHFGPMPSSVRLVGEPGVSRLNLYFGKTYTYNATNYSTSQPNIAETFTSILLVGDVPVQLYLERNFQGTSYCLEIFPSIPYTFLDDVDYIGLKPGDVKSIRFGCSSDAKLIVANSEFNHLNGSHIREY